MKLADWREAPLRADHRRDQFDCGEIALNLYLARFARQNHERGAAKTFVAEGADDVSTVLGYYTLSIASLAYDRAPDVIRRGLGRYEVPVYRLARLAVTTTQQGRGVGAGLLYLAGCRCLAASEQVGGLAMLIDAKNESVAGWYRSFGAVARPEAPLSLLMPLATIADTLKPRR